MNDSIVIFLCFLPAIILFILLKLILWATATKNEIEYVTEEAKKPHGPYLSWNDDEWENELFEF